MRFFLVLLFAVIPVATTVAQATAELSFTVIPPGPVARGAQLELRLAVRNPTETESSAHVAFFLDTEAADTMVGEQTISIPSREKGLARVWYTANAPAGLHQIRYTLNTPAGTQTGTWPIEFVDSSTPSLPCLQGMWIEPLAVLGGATDSRPETLRKVVKDSVTAMDRLGVRVLIIAYVEYLGYFFYPSGIEFFDGDVQRTSKGPDCSFDMVGAFLAEAHEHGMHVFLGLGRSGDTHLLWEFDKPDWDTRNARALSISKSVANELWQKYGSHPSLYGWYLTHEMNDLARASAYYDPLAHFCKGLVPEKPVLVAPAGTPLITPELLANSAVDIFAYQDAVGAGYVPYQYTYKPQSRIAMLEDSYKQYSAWHAKAGKHCWSDLELWEMDGSQGYGGSYPASFSRVKQQIDIASRYTGMLTGYAYHGYLQPPDVLSEKPLPRAQKLYLDYADYLQGLSLPDASRQEAPGPAGGAKASPKEGPPPTPAPCPGPTFAQKGQCGFRFAAANNARGSEMPPKITK